MSSTISDERSAFLQMQSETVLRYSDPGTWGNHSEKGAGLGLYVTFQEAAAQNPLKGKKIINYNDICHIVLPQEYHVPVGNAWFLCDHFD